MRFRLGLPALWVAHCHCSMYRRAQGAGFVTWAGTAEARFALESGADRDRHCAWPDKDPERVTVRAGRRLQQTSAADD